MSLVKYNPYREVNSFFGYSFDELFESFLPTYRTDTTKVDIKEYDDKVEVIAEVFGFKKEDIDIKYEKGVLTLCGEVKKEKEDETSKFLHKEIGTKKFCRKFTLGEAFDIDKIDAKINEGVLTISLPKSEKQLPRQIEIK